MAADLDSLVKFVRSVISPAQVVRFIKLLEEGVDSPKGFDPEAAVGEGAQRVQIAAPAGLEDILKEIEEAYSEAKFPALSPAESRMVRDAYPQFIERCSAFQGRHLVKMLRERIK